jgi:hypothetical protein
LSSHQTSSIPTRGPNRFTANFRHDTSLTAEILIAQTQEVGEDKGFIAVSNSIEVDIEVIITEEEQAQPRGQGVHRNNEQDTNYPSLLSRVSVIS